MKQLVAVGLISGVLGGPLLSPSLVAVSSSHTVQLAHRESSIRVLHSAQGYRIVPAVAQSQP